MLLKKKILLGITGGIAAYKCAQLVRLLVKEGAEVRVVMTEAAKTFVTPQTLSVLSKHEVLSDFFEANNIWNNHVKLADWADVFLIAPLTANTLAKMSSGSCDNFLLTCYFSMRNKTIVAPAMDLEMYRHVSVKKNLETIKAFGNLVIPPEHGELASGLIGEGRMAEPEQILKFVKDHFSKHLKLGGKKALVNAGPTYEAIDPVRYIGNRSSGKMGIALAEALAEEGAEVLLILGPSSEAVVNSAIKVIRVESSDEMFEQTYANYKNADIVFCSAAVADYKPAKVSIQKIKKSNQVLNLELIKTKDILLKLGEEKQHQCLIGFALETENLIENAKEKLKKKNLDIIIANAATDNGAGFGADNNKITIIDKHNNFTNFELKSKREVAVDAVNYVISYLKLK